MTRNAIVVGAAALALAVGGCASVRGEQDAPAASISSAAASLPGHWQGTLWETGAWLIQGATPLDLQISEDGTWRGKAGKADTSGTAWLDRHGWLVLSGSVGPSNGHQEAVYYELRGDSVRRWGEVAASFTGGRIDHASVSLRKVESTQRQEGP